VTVEAESKALHARVLAFARAAVVGAGGVETFDALAVALAEYQSRHIPGLRRLREALGAVPLGVDSIPAVPVDAFRLARVAAHPAELDSACFTTSGTTGAAPGMHPMRSTHTYRELSLLWGGHALATPWPGRRLVVALAPPPGVAPASSLGFMMRVFMESFDGRSLSPGAPPDFDASERWLAGPDGIDVEGLRRAAAVASSRGEPLLVLATGFALVLLLDALAGGAVDVPARTIVMTTGGFKGRTRELPPADLARGVAQAFGIPEAQVVGEYGMTELTSQLYEGTAPGGALRGERGVFLPPPWLRVAAVDPATLDVLPFGALGIARFVDLGNVDSAVAIVTQDLVRQRGEGVELHGRRQGAPLRGCSLAIEQMVQGARGA
jgi:hypothetical protein